MPVFFETRDLRPCKNNSDSECLDICSGLSPCLKFQNIHILPHFWKSKKRCIKSNFELFHLFLLLLLAGDISTNPGPNFSHQIKISCANVQSLRNKGPSIESYVWNNLISCLCLTETHLSDLDTSSSRNDLKPHGFDLLERPQHLVDVEEGPSEGVESHEVVEWELSLTNDLMLLLFLLPTLLLLNSNLNTLLFL